MLNRSMSRFFQGPRSSRALSTSLVTGRITPILKMVVFLEGRSMTPASRTKSDRMEQIWQKTEWTPVALPRHPAG
jgi:hypothetical protein